MSNEKKGFVQTHNLDLKKISSTISGFMPEITSDKGIHVDSLLEKTYDSFSKEELAVLAADGIATKCMLMSNGIPEEALKAMANG